MKLSLLLISVLLAANVWDVSAGRRWWDGVRKGFKDYWKENGSQIIGKLLPVLLNGRSVDEVDMNSDEKLDSSELLAHLDARDVNEMMSEIDTDGDGSLDKEDIERYVSNAILQNA